MNGVGYRVQDTRQVGGPVQLRIFNTLGKKPEQLLVVLCGGFAVGIHPDLIVEQGEAEGIALFSQGVHERGGGLRGEAQFVFVLQFLRVPLVPGVVHGGGAVHHNLAAQVGFFFEPFDKKFVRATVHLPVDVAGGFAGVVQAVFGKFDRKTVKRAFVQPNNKAFYNLTG